VVSATGSDLEDARNAAYEDIEKIDFKDIYYRKDIGKIY
jgi:phosphoribosylamine--glycine ligase